MSSLIVTLLVLLGIMFCLWLASLKLNDVSIVDLFWGMGFVITAWLSLVLNQAEDDRSWIFVTLITIWGLRYTWYIGRRNIGHGEDYRYQQIRENRGDKFKYSSLYIIFFFQGIILWFLSLSYQCSIPSDKPINIIDYIGIAIWVTGFLIESIADEQLYKFKKDPNNSNKVLDQGLWRYSRHPNYFGEATLWFGIYYLSLAAGNWWTIFSPLLLTYLLLKFSGVSLLEKAQVKRKPKYQDYIDRTSPFIPWFPKA